MVFYTKPTVMRVNVNVKLSLWSAIKMRICGWKSIQKMFDKENQDKVNIRDIDIFEKTWGKGKAWHCRYCDFRGTYSDMENHKC